MAAGRARVSVAGMKEKSGRLYPGPRAYVDLSALYRTGRAAADAREKRKIRVEEKRMRRHTAEAEEKAVREAIDGWRWI